MMEHADDPALTVSIEAGKWREDHAACASRLGRITTTEEPCPTCALKDAELTRLRARIEVLENAVEWALTTDQTHQWKAELRRRAKEG
jgi:hypothetical protein